MTHDDLLALLDVDVSRECQVELDHRRLELDNPLQVRIASPEVIDDQVGAGPLRQLGDDVAAQLEMREHGRLGDLQVDGPGVKADGVIGPDQPPRRELVRVQVDEERDVAARAERSVADQSSKIAAGTLCDRSREKHRWFRVLRHFASDQSFVCEGRSAGDLDDRLKNHADVGGGERSNAARSDVVAVLGGERPVDPLSLH